MSPEKLRVIKSSNNNNIRNETNEKPRTHFCQHTLRKEVSKQANYFTVWQNLSVKRKKKKKTTKIALYNFEEQGESFVNELSFQLVYRFAEQHRKSQYDRKKTGLSFAVKTKMFIKLNLTNFFPFVWSIMIASRDLVVPIRWLPLQVT